MGNAIAERGTSAFGWRGLTIPRASFDAIGLIALADLDTIARRTALIGTATLIDALVLCPGIHRQQKASHLNQGELPPTAALTSGYVFRIENQATVAYLQGVGKTGQLVTLAVESLRKGPRYYFWTLLFGPSGSLLASLLMVVAMLSTVTSITFLAAFGDWWGVGIISALIVARLVNIFLIRQRTTPGWHGVPEPGVAGDLLVLLSQDRWIRIQGSVDALKVVTSGRWLNDMTFVQSSLEATATLLVYVSAALASNATQNGKVLLATLLLVSVALLGVSNKQARALYMHGHKISVKGAPRAYARRLDLAKELIKETKRHDWAIGLGMVKAEDYGEKSVSVTL